MNLFQYLFTENPMQIETLRAVRRFSVSGAANVGQNRNVMRVFAVICVAMYAWLLLTLALFGEDMTQGLLWFEFGLLTLVVPLSLYGAISGEQERLTWDGLILTNLSPVRIIVGKLLWRLVLVAGIQVLFLPPLLVTHHMARFTPDYSLDSIYQIQGIFTAWYVFLATFTLWVSSRTKRSVITLTIVILFLLTTLLLVPALVMLFFGNYVGSLKMHSDYSPMQSPEFWWYTLMTNPLLGIGLFSLHLNPGMSLGMLTEKGLQDYHTNFMFTIGSGAIPHSEFALRIRALGWVPFVYFALSVLCLIGTLRTLAQMGLPLQTSGKWGRAQ